jgi:hypothetical protein
VKHKVASLTKQANTTPTPKQIKKIIVKEDKNTSIYIATTVLIILKHIWNTNSS